MTERDLQRVLNESVRDVRLSDDARRAIRLAAREERPVKMKKCMAIMLVLVLMLSATVAVAAELGLFDFLARNMGQEVLPGAEKLVQSDVAYGETDDVIYTVKQAMYDGKSAALLVEMRPKDDKTLLMGEGWWEEDPIGGYICDTEEEMLAEKRTVAQYAADNGYDRMIEALISLPGYAHAGIDEWNNNVLTVLYSFEAEGDELVLAFEYFQFDRIAGEAQRVPDEITLKATAPLWTVSSRESFDAPGFGIRVDGITITGTAVQSYWTLTYTVTDVEIARSLGWNANVVDMNREYLPRGVLGTGGGDLPEGNGQQLTYSGSFGPMDQPPEQLMILLRNWDDHSLNNYFPITLK